MGKKDKERRVYPKEFKAEAVALAEKHEKPVCQAASDLGINEKLLFPYQAQQRLQFLANLPLPVPHILP
jgi:transposase-like protein